MTVSLEPRTAERVRRCAARTPGGASGYLERLVKQDQLAEAVRDHGEWWRANPDYAEQTLEEAAAARDADRSS